MCVHTHTPFSKAILVVARTPKACQGLTFTNSPKKTLKEILHSGFLINPLSFREYEKVFTFEKKQGPFIKGSHGNRSYTSYNLSLHLFQLKKQTNQKFRLCYKRKERNWLKILKVSLEHKDSGSFKFWFISKIRSYCKKKKSIL